MRVPEATIGWPKDTAPPWIFTFFISRFNSLIATNGTTEKASLISNKSISWLVKSFWSNNYFIADTGAVVNHSGSWEKFE